MIQAGCSGVQSAGTLQGDEETITNVSPFPVIARKMVHIDVETELYIGGESASIDAQSLSHFGLNIPTIWAGITA
jgi:hypothetical protein